MDSSLSIRAGASGLLRYAADRRMLGVLTAHAALTLGVWLASPGGMTQPVAIAVLG